MTNVTVTVEVEDSQHQQVQIVLQGSNIQPSNILELAEDAARRVIAAL